MSFRHIKASPGLFSCSTACCDSSGKLMTGAECAKTINNRESKIALLRAQLREVREMLAEIRRGR